MSVFYISGRDLKDQFSLVNAGEFITFCWPAHRCLPHRFLKTILLCAKKQLLNLTRLARQV